MTPDEIAAIQEWLLILEARDLELPEFHAMQLKVAKATHVMLDRVAALEAELAAADDRYSRLAGWYGDECKRREAAEVILHMIDDECAFGSPLMKDLDAHFARYKD